MPTPSVNLTAKEVDVRGLLRDQRGLPLRQNENARHKVEPIGQRGHDGDQDERIVKAVLFGVRAVQIARRSNTAGPPPVICQRLYMTSLMIMNCAAQIPEQADAFTRDAVLANVFLMEAAALQAPIDAAAAEAMTGMHDLNELR